MVLLLLLLLVVGVAEAAELVDDAEVDTFVDVEEVGFCKLLNKCHSVFVTDFGCSLLCLRVSLSLWNECCS